MRLIAMLVINYAREIFNRCLVISETMIERAECVITQGRRIRDDVQQTLAVFDHFGNLKTIPTTLFFTQYRIGGDVEIEDAFDFTSLRTTRAKPNDKHNAGDEH